MNYIFERNLFFSLFEFLFKYKPGLLGLADSRQNQDLGLWATWSNVRGLGTRGSLRSLPNKSMLSPSETQCALKAILDWQKSKSTKKCASSWLSCPAHILYYVSVRLVHIICNLIAPERGFALKVLCYSLLNSTDYLHWRCLNKITLC